jgi:signal transduction histidine kinase
MNIRSSLTLQFILIVVIILVMAYFLIYLFSADYREEAFYDRLHSKANNTAKLLIDVDEVDITLLTKIEKDNTVNLPNEVIVIFDYKNKELFTTDHDKTLNIDKSLLDRIRLEEEIRFRQDNYEVLGFLFKGQFDRFAVISAATDIYGFNKLKNLRTILIIVFVISIFVVSISGWLFAGKALQPISKVVHQVDEISITSLNLRVDEGNGKDEIAQLAQTFNNMLTRLEDSFILQKNFIANASHELRTPLTAITGQLEVSLLNSRSNDDYQKVMVSILEDIKSLSILSNRLLLLAQTSTIGLNLKISTLRIDEVIWQVRDELLKHNPAFGIIIDIDTTLDEEFKLLIKGDEHLVKVAISNIMENGCKYSDNHTVKILITGSSNELTVIFVDTGIGIPPEDLHNIFEPFYRANNTQNVKGHGIGLSMVKRILTLHHSTIEINSAQGSGTTITVSFPQVHNAFVNS